MASADEIRIREQLAPGPTTTATKRKPGRQPAPVTSALEIARRSKNDRKYSEWLRTILLSKAQDGVSSVASVYRDRTKSSAHKDNWEAWIEHVTRKLVPDWSICGGDLMGHREMLTAQNRFLNRYLYLDTEKRLASPLFVQVVARLDAQQAMYRCGHTEILPCMSCTRLQTRVKALEAQLSERGLREIPLMKSALEWQTNFFTRTTCAARARRRGTCCAARSRSTCRRTWPVTSLSLIHS